ncbi:MAG: chromosome segregation protein SMC [Mariprofundus sp.]|nr:chromosome segregation protein SMC [Mariprofundus sp.]
MRLKRLEMAGFKSFVDPTKIDLDQGITAIVGPNGCGKSNIVDALRWVLGEHSARHLRGGVMDDLIFQGSDTRAPVAICDVELTFAIDKGALSSPYHELDEIRIRRRLTRDGGSDAFINGKMVRIKDVVDLFLDTGISTRAYAIVEQGSIARMVTAKPEERRVIFEEAAGVMKYRSRRRESERRMKDTRQNLDRVLDLLEEVRSQCRSLKQQASRAERFKKMQYEFSQMQSINLALRYRSLQQNYQAIEQQLAKARTTEADVAQQLAHCEKEVSAARERVIAHESEAQGIQDELRHAERQRADLQQQAERMAGDRRLLAERKQVLESHIAEMTGRQQQLVTEIEQIKQQLSSQNDSVLQDNQRIADESVHAALTRYHEQGEQRDRLLAEFERLRHSNEQSLLQRQQAEQALERLEARERQLNERLVELGNQQNEQTSTLQDTEQKLAAVQHARRSCEVDLETAQENLEGCRSKREQSLQALNAQEASLRELNGVVQELRGRTKNQDVSETLRDAIRARGGVWMDESLHVPEGLEAAVAAALRGRSANVRIPAGVSVTAGGDWKEIMNQVSGVPVALFSGQHASASGQNSSLADAMGMGPEHPLFDVFAPVTLVDEIIQVEGLAGCCVSRDGWRREDSGWLVPPAGNRTAGQLAIRRKLRDAESQRGREEALLIQVKQQFEESEHALERQQQVWQQAHLAAMQSESDYHGFVAAVGRLQAEVESLQKHQQRLQSDLVAVTEERKHWLSQAAQATHVDQQVLDRSEEKLNSQNDMVRQAEQELAQARHLLAQADQAMALFAQARDNLLRESERLSQEEHRLKGQIENDRARQKQVEENLNQARDQHELDQQLTHAVGAVEKAHQAMNEVRTRGHMLQQLQHESERGERQIRQHLQLAAEHRQSIEVQQAQDETRLQDVETEIQTRCQSTAADLLQRIDLGDEKLDAEVIMQRAGELEERLGRFGPVNLLAIEEFEQASEREGFLAGQVSDLETSLATLAETIARIDRTTRQRFKEVFEQTNIYFKQTFPQLFGGGRAELRLDSDDVLTAGVEVIAQPPGKRLQDVTLLSGGEKALTAVALVFSIFKIKPAPFCVLDEVDAPLDDANVGRFADMVRELADRVQFLSISHNKITMQKADRLIGVSMPEPGVSKIVAVDLENVPH